MSGLVWLSIVFLVIILLSFLVSNYENFMPWGWRRRWRRGPGPWRRGWRWWGPYSAGYGPYWNDYPYYYY